MFSYPPSFEQIDLGITSFLGLWLLRLLTLLIFFAICFLVSRQVTQSVRKFLFIILFSVPVVWYDIATSPLAIFRLSLIVLIALLVSRVKNNYLKISSLVVGILLIFLFNSTASPSRPILFDALNLTRNQAEVMDRITTEDILIEKIDLPLNFRRLSYNKYFFAIKNFSVLSFRFIDLETLFFQEVHPLDQKGFVIFYWPIIWLVIFGLWLGLTNKIKLPPKFIVYLIFFSFLSYLLSDLPPHQYLLPLIIPLAILIATTLNFLLSHFRPVAIISLIILAYCSLNNLVDFSRRPDYWLDNRPLVYQFWFSAYLQNPSLQPMPVVMSTVIGPSQKYCRYYLSNCQQFTFVNFDLSQTTPQPKTLYAGFSGNFVGKQLSDNFSENIVAYFQSRDLEILAQQKLRDNVAFGFGQNIFLIKSP